MKKKRTLVSDAKYNNTGEMTEQDKLNLIATGAKLVKPELISKWNEYAKINIDDEYSSEIIKATIAVMEALTDGKTPQEAESTLSQYDLTGFMAYAVAEGVNCYHSRGDEYRKYWNELCGGNDSMKGVINPAIVEIETKS
jgi:hypothetical protein